MLALAAPTFKAPLETFMSDHVFISRPGKRYCSAIIMLAKRVHLHGVKSAAPVVQTESTASMFPQRSIPADNGDSEGLPVAISEGVADAVREILSDRAGAGRQRVGKVHANSQVRPFGCENEVARCCRFCLMVEVGQ